MRSFVLLFTMVLACARSLRDTTSSSGYITVNPHTNMLVDGLGRERFFHGTNVVYKHPPYHPKTTGFDEDSFSEQDMKRLQGLGLNSIRLGMMMPGYVPKRGEYNETYIQVIEGIVSKAAEYGIYTLLDMHQDVLSSRLCGEGLPEWIINTDGAKPFPMPLEEPYAIDPDTGTPSPEDCSRLSWASYYGTEAVAAGFQHLYENTDNLRDEWAMFWKKTAQHFKGYTHVLGYELINEPFCGDFYKNPALLIPGVADSVNLEPAYEAVQAAIREVNTQHSIFFEGVTWDFFEVGFSQVPGGESYRNRSVLSYHYYEPPDFSKTLNFAARMNDLRRLKCGGFLTEMFTVGADFASMNTMFELCDKHLQSWHGWMYKPYSCVKLNLACLNKSVPGKPDIHVEDTSRTFPQAVAGNTQSFHFNRTTKAFSLVYRLTADCKSTETVVYFNEKMHYPNGYVVQVSPRSTTVVKDGFLLIIKHDKQLPQGTLVEFSLHKK